MTGVYNRVKIDEVIEVEIKRANRNNSNLNIILIDIDNFKKVNDLYGHLIGDKVLVEFAKTLKENIRTTDVVARW